MRKFDETRTSSYNIKSDLLASILKTIMSMQKGTYQFEMMLSISNISSS